MPPFSPHAGALAESETLAITAAAKRLRAEGVDVAPFAAGEPESRVATTTPGPPSLSKVAPRNSEG